MKKKRTKVVVIGGGTGTFTVLSGLRAYPELDLTAIVTMADDGGSTGILRDEFGVLPPGDLRQCLVALSDASDVLRKLFTHRFDRGGMAGHTFGNIFISALEHVMGDLDSALDIVGDVLKIKGTVIPVTLSKVKLVTAFHDGTQLVGQHALDSHTIPASKGIKRMWLVPRPKPNPKALRAIAAADLIVMGPGSLYSSLIPNLLVPSIAKAIVASRAKKVYVVNLMNKRGHTDDFTVADYLRTIESFVGTETFDVVVYNTTPPSRALVARYKEEGVPVSGVHDLPRHRRMIGRNIIASRLYQPSKRDPLRRTLIRHDPKKLARAILNAL